MKQNSNTLIAGLKRWWLCTARYNTLSLSWADRALSRGVWRQVAWLLVLVAAVFLLLWGIASSAGLNFVAHGSSESAEHRDDVSAETRGGKKTDSSESAMSGFDIWDVFSESVDMNQYLRGWHRFWICVFRFMGSALLGGILISTFSNMTDRRVEKCLKGLTRYWSFRFPWVLKNHYVIVGNGEEILELIEAILEGDVAKISGKNEDYRGEAIIVQTHGDVERLREQVFSGLKHPTFERVIFFQYGDLELKECLAKAYPERAKMIFVLGDKEEKFGRDVRNLSSMARIKEIVCLHKAASIPLFVQIDGVSAHSVIQKLDCFPGKDVSGVASRPFNIYENWARLLWGFYGRRWTEKDVAGGIAREEDVGTYVYRSLDYRPIREDSKDYVRLVVLGFGKMGQALALQAIRVCHYANFRKDNPQTKTKIVIVDRDPETELFFNSQYPYLSQIYDVDIEFMIAPAESTEVRKALAIWAKEEHCQLTVAVCFADPDASLSVGLNLPEEVYEHFDAAAAKSGEKDASGREIECLGAKMKKDGNSVLIRLSVYGEVGHAVNREAKRYKHVKTFGGLGKEFDAELLRDEVPKLINWFYDSNINAMKLVSSADEISEEMAVNKEKIDAAWCELGERVRWSNRFQADSYRVQLNYLGLETRKNTSGGKGGVFVLPPNPILDIESHESISEDETKENALLKNVIADMEHRRWNAEKTLAGYRAWRTELPFSLAADKSTVKNETYSRHTCIRETEQILSSDLPEARRVCLKDCYPIRNMPYLLKYDGYDIYLKKTDKR